MRTKILLTAVLSAACVATSVAQTVYSVNAVGYVNVTVAAGKLALLANPLDLPTNSIAAVLPDAPANTVVYIWKPDSSGFYSAVKRASGAWTGDSGVPIPPGVGFFIKNAGATDMTVTFVGEVKQGTNLVVNVPAGLAMLGSLVPKSGLLQTELGFPAAANDTVYIWTGNGYASSVKRSSGAWSGAGEPTIGVAQGFFYNAKAATEWKTSFVIQP